MSAPLLPFVQLELTHAIGPGQGRYVVGEGPHADVLQVALVGAPQSRGRGPRRARSADPSDTPSDVELLHVSWIGTSQALERTSDADERLAALRRDEADREELIAAVLGIVNAAIRAHRAAARDPYLSELSREDPRAVRIGYGTAADLTSGRWTQAFTAPGPRTGRVPLGLRLGPAETAALVLSGRLDLLEAEELALRALGDLEQDRPRAAAVGLHACVRLLSAELREAGDPRADVATWREQVAALEPDAERLADLALGGELDEVATVQVADVLAAVERVLDAWRAPAATPDHEHAS